MLLDDTILPGYLTPEEAREACRSLKGSILRQEVYALDGTEESGRPYTVTENNSTIRLLQPRDHTMHAVFLTRPRESVTFHYERKLYEIDSAWHADPRVMHNLTLKVDEFGNVLESAAIAYGRRFDDRSHLLSDADRAEQRQILATFAENRYTNAVQEAHAYRTPVIAETRNYELFHVRPASRRSGITNLFRFEELKAEIARASDTRHDLPFQDFSGAGAEEGVPYRRLIGENRKYYRADGLEQMLPLGVVEALALPGQDYKLSLTGGLVAEAYRRERPPEDLIPDVTHALHHEGRYVELGIDGQWWIPSGRVFYAPHECSAGEELEQARRHFFRPRRFVDPFGYATIVSYDEHDLLPVYSRDAVGNTISAEIDFRVLSPWRVTDPNRNRSEVAFDALGMVTGTAVIGKQGQHAGDSLEGFVADLDEATILEHLAHPMRHPLAILKLATTRIAYDLFAYLRTRDAEQPEPAAVYTIARETHAADLRPGHHTKVQQSFSYSDGFGREIQKKLQAEPGPLCKDGPAVNPRWVGSGWTIFNNKGKPVRQYEPFFTARHSFEFGNVVGVSSILFYDPVERVVATLRANHTYEKVVFDPWRQETWDVNDTALQTDAARDPDVGAFFAKLPKSDYLPAWYSTRIEGQLGSEEQQAAIQTAVHANTPSLAYGDSLGRAFLSVAHNRVERAGLPVDEYFATRTELDIQGNKRAIRDALGRVAMRYEYDMLKMTLRQISIDAGTRWTLNDVMGKALLAWDSRGYRLRHEYDALHRPTHLHVRRGAGAEFLAERMVYGEGQPDDLALNLRGKPFRQFDAAGIVTNEHYDFKGNLLRSTRRLLEDYKSDVNWLQSPELERQIFETATEYDALNRRIALTTPDASVVRPRYNEANLLESLSVNLRGAGEATPFVTYVNYDAKGQREIIEYGNGAHTDYSYDPLTFRMIHLETRRRADHARLQDLHYTYDPTGNITSIRDDAQETVYFRNQVVSARGVYICDATYRLISADGREHAGIPGEPQTTYNDLPRMHEPLPSDGQALHRCCEHYEYDAVGNIVKLLHTAVDGNWSRLYSYGEGSNRLSSTKVGQYVEPYAYDADGNMTRMPHLRQMDWDFKDQLQATCVQATKLGRGETTYYVYDSGGQRVRKVTERPSGSRRHERVYLGSFETYREYDSVGARTLERETLHVMDDKRRVALVETKRQGESATRFQFDNHMGSACLELDEAGAVITYEEYYPYGSTSYQAGRSKAETSLKRYRYMGRERDDESGLYYCAARYCATWIGRWISTDPKGISGGLNLYEYSNDNPVVLSDPGGRDPNPNATPDPDKPVASVTKKYQAEGSGTSDNPSDQKKEDIPPAPPPPPKDAGSNANLQYLSNGNQPGGATLPGHVQSETVAGGGPNFTAGGGSTSLTLARRAGLFLARGGLGGEYGVTSTGPFLHLSDADQVTLQFLLHVGDPNFGIYAQGGFLTDAAGHKEGGIFNLNYSLGGSTLDDQLQGYVNQIVTVASTGQVANQNVTNFASATLLAGGVYNPKVTPTDTSTETPSAGPEDPDVLPAQPQQPSGDKVAGPNAFGAELAGTINSGMASRGALQSFTGTALLFYTRAFNNNQNLFGVAIGASYETNGGGWTGFLRVGIGLDRAAGGNTAITGPFTLPPPLPLP